MGCGGDGDGRAARASLGDGADAVVVAVQAVVVEDNVAATASSPASAGSPRADTARTGVPDPGPPHCSRCTGEPPGDVISSEEHLQARRATGEQALGAMQIANTARSSPLANSFRSALGAVRRDNNVIRVLCRLGTM